VCPIVLQTSAHMPTSPSPPVPASLTSLNCQQWHKGWMNTNRVCCTCMHILHDFNGCRVLWSQQVLIIFVVKTIVAAGGYEAMKLWKCQLEWDCMTVNFYREKHISTWKWQFYRNTYFSYILVQGLWYTHNQSTRIAPNKVVSQATKLVLVWLLWN